MSPEREHTAFVGSRTTPSPGFYIGLAIFALLLAAAPLLLPSPRKVVDQHANPNPGSPLPAQVMTSSGSNLYHAAAACPYMHQHATTMPASQAVKEGLVPCPYCVGNSSAHLTPTVLRNKK